MSETETPPSARFNRAAALHPEASKLHAHIDGLVAEMNERFKEEEAGLVRAKFRDLTERQLASPELARAYARDYPIERLMKAAKLMVKFDHLNEINKLRRTSQMMITHGLER
jgi:hypothetical protein